MKSLSIRSHIILWFCILTIVLIAAYGAVLYYNAVQSAYDLSKTSLASDVDLLAEEIDVQEDSVALDLEGVPSSLKDHKSVVFEIYTFPDLKSVATLGNHKPLPLSLKPFNKVELIKAGSKHIEAERALGLKKSFETIHHGGKDLHLCTSLYYVPLDDKEDEESQENENSNESEIFEPQHIIIVVAHDLAPLQTNLETELLKISGLAALFIPFAILLGLFLARRIVSPISEIVSHANTISTSDLSLTIPSRKNKDELDQLIISLNGAFDSLRRAIASQKRFASDASHELRTPVAIIRSSCEVTLRHERSNEEYREALATNLDAAGRIQELLEGLLFLAQADEGAVEKAEMFFLLSQVIEEAWKLLAQSASEKKVTLNLDCDPKLEVWGDRRLFFTVFLNLISNAVRYNKEAGKIYVEVSQNEKDTLISIRDEGIGIPTEQQPYIFERFYRSDKARSRVKGGFGIGLSIVQEIVKYHSGNIKVRSVAGEGTTFEIKIPNTRTSAS